MWDTISLNNTGGKRYFRWVVGWHLICTFWMWVWWHGIDSFSYRGGFFVDIVRFSFWKMWWLWKEPLCLSFDDVHFAVLPVFFGSKTAWMLGSTPPCAIVTPPSSLFSSSSFRIANCKCRGVILVFLLSLAAFPANSKISAVRYSITAARYTGLPAPIRWA